MLLRLCDPFVRGDSLRSDVVDGHGLSIARSIAKLHGGTVEPSGRSPIGRPGVHAFATPRACTNA